MLYLIVITDSTTVKNHLMVKGKNTYTAVMQAKSAISSHTYRLVMKMIIGVTLFQFLLDKTLDIYL